MERRLFFRTSHHLNLPDHGTRCLECIDLLRPDSLTFAFLRRPTSITHHSKSGMQKIKALIIFLFAVVWTSRTVSSSAHSSGIDGLDLDEDRREGRKPHIIFIMADDLGWHKISVYCTCVWRSGKKCGTTTHINISTIFESLQYVLYPNPYPSPLNFFMFNISGAAPPKISIFPTTLQGTATSGTTTLPFLPHTWTD